MSHRLSAGEPVISQHVEPARIAYGSDFARLEGMTE